ncbi:MAG: histidinol dehydrogenase [Pseudomonadota bacterium]
MSAAAPWLRRLDARREGFAAALETLLHWDITESSAVNDAAAKIIARVRQEGPAALLALTAEFDRVEAASLAELALTPADFEAAFRALSPEQRDSLQQAHDRIERYHLAQRQEDFEIEDEYGNRLGQRITPMDRVGVYVPGGQAAYPSTVLMTAVPARVAGVREIIMTVPTPGGVRNPLVLGAAHLAGVTQGFTLGGAQAIAALAYGCEPVPRVDKIVGPGGAFVAAAKRLVYGQVGIDAIAGPSEILILADASADPRWLALDLFSQAEHDAAAQALLVSPDPQVVEAVAAAIDELLPAQPRAELIRQSLGARGALMVCADLAQAVAIANRIAPEHLQLAVAAPRALLPELRHAGAVFLGVYSAEVMGDYVAGPSHVLPTFGTARFSSPLGVYDFVKRSSLIELSAAGADALGRLSGVLADGEGLHAHAAAARARIPGYDRNRER